MRGQYSSQKRLWLPIYQTEVTAGCMGRREFRYSLVRPCPATFPASYRQSLDFSKLAANATLLEQFAFCFEHFIFSVEIV